MKQTRHIQANLHPGDEAEKEAIRIWEDWLKQDRTPRQLITSLILTHAGHTPAVFQAGVDRQLQHLAEHLDGRLDQLAERLESNLTDLLRNIKRADPQGFRRFAEADEDDDLDMDDSFIQNAQKGMRKTFKQRQQERSG